jgi:hypothetical protein
LAAAGGHLGAKIKQESAAKKSALGTGVEKFFEIHS